MARRVERIKVDLGGTTPVTVNGQAVYLNRHVYFPPKQGGSTGVLKVNVDAETASTHGSAPGAGTYGWAYGFLAPNDKIYWVPAPNTAPVAIFDPSTDTLTYSGSTYPTVVAAVMVGTNIYAIGFSSGGIQIDTTTDTITSLTGTRTGSYYGLVDGGNGSAYMFPYTGSSGTIRKITGTAFSTVAAGSSLTSYRYVRAHLAPNGYIYALPQVGSPIIKFDPATDTYTLLEDDPGTDRDVFQSVITSDGVIYGFPTSGGDVTKFDTTTDTLTTFTNSAPDTNTGVLTTAAVLAEDDIFFMPFSGGNHQFGVLDTTTDTFESFGGLMTTDYSQGVYVSDLERIYTAAADLVTRIGAINLNLYPRTMFF
jgi:hypothetical protein